MSTSLIPSPITVNNIFNGADDIRKIVEDFESDKLDANYKDSEGNYLHVALAPSYGKNKLADSIGAMDELMQVSIASTMRTLAKVPEKGRTWDKVMEAMLNNPTLERVDNAMHRKEKLVKPSRIRFFRYDRANTDQAVVEEVKAWFGTLIKDDDVLRDTKIDIDFAARIVAQTGATIETYRSFVQKTEYHQQTLVDIGVLRFPDLENPYFKVYHIRLLVWAQCARLLFAQEDSNGITGEYRSCDFMPRREVIQCMAKEIRDKAAAEANAMFAD